MTEGNIKVGCLWMNENGKKAHANIIINEVRYVAFPNDYKLRDNDPDWLIYTNKPLPPKE